MNTEGSIAVIGAGLMGAAIATLCAAHGHRVVLNDKDDRMLRSFASRATPIAESLAADANAVSTILGRVETTTSLPDAVDGASLVQEAIHENLDAKRALFKELDALCGPEVLLATNTSSFLISDICGGLSGRGRIIGIHYVSPPHLIRAVEIIVASFTEEALVQRARRFLDSIDHVGLVCREMPGFLINRLQYALKAEAQRMVDQGAASVEDIDAAVRLAIGPRLALWGPLMQEDMSTTKKTVLAVTEYIREASGEAHFAATPALRQLASAGQNGAASGAGWYKWNGEYASIVKERDRQLKALLTWLRDNDRRDKLGASGANA